MTRLISSDDNSNVELHSVGGVPARTLMLELGWANDVLRIGRMCT